MANVIRTVSRRRVLAILGALMLLGSSAPVIVHEPLAAPAPHHRWYYSGGNLVGEGEWGCDFRYRQIWGVSTSSYTVQYLDCSGPIDPEVAR